MLTYEYLKTSLISVGDFNKLVSINSNVDATIILAAILQFQGGVLKDVIPLDLIDQLCDYVANGTTPIPANEELLTLLTPVVAYGTAAHNLSNLVSAQIMPKGITNYPDAGTKETVRSHFMTLFEYALTPLYEYCESHSVECNKIKSVSNCPIYLG